MYLRKFHWKNRENIKVHAEMSNQPDYLTNAVFNPLTICSEIFSR